MPRVRAGRGRRGPAATDGSGAVNVAPHLFWITSRAAGGAALLLASASVGLGLMMSSKRKTPNRRDHRALHEALSLTTLAMVALHGVSLLGDAYLNPGLSGIAIPFVGVYRPLAEKTRDRPLLDAPQAVEDYLKWLIGTRPNEVFVTLFLDIKHCLITVDESAKGSISRVAVYPREIVRRALTLNAASLIVAHNHPSGGVEPSANDRRLTRVLQDSLALIDVRLLDHLVVASNEVFSFSRQGWMPA